MAELVVFPIRIGSAEQAARLHHDLDVAFKRGSDLGSRASHIRASGDSLLELCRELEIWLDKSQDPQIKLCPHEQAAIESVGKILEVSRRVAECAQNFDKLHGI